MDKSKELIDTRICDLRLDLAKHPLRARVLALYGELSSRKLQFRPPCYFADEWFVPEGDPVIGIPFFLASKALSRLERSETGGVEGSTRPYFMRLLRHEAGHAISHAFRLHRQPLYRRLFGPSSKRFSEAYTFNPRSRDFVINLNDHYAQSHPDEDFAETFAVWLTLPEPRWRKTYADWRALTKLEAVAQMMREIEGKRPPVQKCEKMCHVSTLRYTLKQFYARRHRASGRRRDHAK